MKRREPIKTEKKQLGGIIKLLKKVSPKLASKAKGRLLVSRLRQVKDLKTPYIFPGEVRARGLASVAYSRTMHTKDIPKEVDGGQGIFTKESLDNLYRNIFSIGAPIGVGLYATQN